MIKILLISLFFVINLYSSEVFILPKDSSKAQEKISTLIENAKNEIFVAMYNFSYKKFAKDLVKASKDGVKVTVLFDKEKIEKDDEVLELFKKNNIKTIINDNNKMHLKAVVIDSKIAIIGSANWTKKSFKENYDLIYISDDKDLIYKLKEFMSNF